MSKERYSRSDKIHNRREKEKDRDNIAKINERIEINANLWSLAKVKKLLSKENPKLLIMNGLEKAIYQASLEIEKSWWELKCHVTDADQQKEWLTGFMDNLQRKELDVYTFLVNVKLDEPSMAQRLHDRVFPPKPVGSPTRR